MIKFVLCGGHSGYRIAGRSLACRSEAIWVLGAAWRQGREDGWTDVVLYTSLMDSFVIIIIIIIIFMIIIKHWSGIWLFLITENINQQKEYKVHIRSCPDKLLFTLCGPWVCVCEHVHARAHIHTHPAAKYSNADLKLNLILYTKFILMDFFVLRFLQLQLRIGIIGKKNQNLKKKQQSKSDKNAYLYERGRKTKQNYPLAGGPHVNTGFCH